MKTELTELKPVSDSALNMHATLGMPSMPTPPPQLQQTQYEVMRSPSAPHSPTFIAVPSSNLVQASHPMASAQGYTMRLGDHSQPSPGSHNSNVIYSSVGQSTGTTSSYTTSTFIFVSFSQLLQSVCGISY